MSDGKVALSNGALSCTFTRQISSNFGIQNFADLTKKVYLLTASGPAESSGNMDYHSSKTSSDIAIDFLASTSYTSEGEDHAKTKAHGNLYCDLISNIFFLKSN